MSEASILDTSWLLERYQVPGDSNPQRYEAVRRQAEAAVLRGRLYATVPVVFEVANHIVNVRNGHHRRRLIGNFRDAVSTSLEDEVPWTIVGPLRDDILLRAQDLAELADRFAAESATGYSLANISVIDLTQRLQSRGLRVHILTFNEQLAAYAG